MDIATIKGAYDAVAFAKTALETFVDAKANAKARDKIAEALERLGNVQDVLFSLREELGRLQEENSSLKESLCNFETWADRSACYSLQETAGSAIVYQSEGPPKHYACPRCYERREIQILQDRRLLSGGFACPSCQTQYLIKSNEARVVGVVPPSSRDW